MLQPESLTTRRFYHAFYQWALLASIPPGEHRVFHTTSRRQPRSRPSQRRFWYQDRTGSHGATDLYTLSLKNSGSKGEKSEKDASSTDAGTYISPDEHDSTGSTGKDDVAAPEGPLKSTDTAAVSPEVSLEEDKTSEQEIPRGSLPQSDGSAKQSTVLAAEESPKSISTDRVGREGSPEEDNTFIQDNRFERRDSPKNIRRVEAKNLVLKDQELVEAVRISLRSLTYPVALITARKPGRDMNIDSETHLPASRGVTVSSFNTVTLSPQPIISFNLKLPSRTWDAIKASGRLRVHLLSASGNSAAMADALTKASEDPLEGFRELEKRGATITTYPGNVPPRIWHPLDILANIQATLMHRRCIRVGDHMLVLASVEDCSSRSFQAEKSLLERPQIWPFTVGLSYAQQAYRGIGRKVVMPSDEASNKDEADLYAQGFGDVSNQHGAFNQDDPLGIGKAFWDDPDADRGQKLEPSAGRNRRRAYVRYSLNDPVFEALQAVRNGAEVDWDFLDALGSATGGNGSVNDASPGDTADTDTIEASDDSDIHRALSSMESDVGAEAQEQEDDYDYGFAPPDHGFDQKKSIEQESESTTSSRTEYKAPLWGPEDVAWEESHRLAENETPILPTTAFSPLVGPNAAQIDDETKRRGSGTNSTISSGQAPNGRRSISSAARAGVFNPLVRRHFFGSTAIQQDANTNRGIDVSGLIEPGALSKTVGDYFGVPDNNQYPRGRLRVTGLHVRQDIMRKAERRLEEEAETLTPKEMAELKAEISTQDRAIFRKLGWNAAAELRWMLDKGRVDFRQAAFLESQIEKRLAWLLTDAKTARTMLEAGKMSKEKFEAVKARLEMDHDALVTETNRLRQVVDEEGEGGGADDD